MKLIGHRGARDEAPENTIAGFRHAISLGIFDFELDLRLSKDGQLVVIHDATVDRTTNGNGKVARLTAKELNQLNAQFAHPLWDQACSVPLLSDLLAACPEINSVQLEMKADNRAEAYAVAEATHEFCQQYKGSATLILTSINRHCLTTLARLESPQPRGLVAEYLFPPPVHTAKKLGCQYLCLDQALCSSSRVKAATDAGLIVSVWTVNDLDVARKLAAINGISSLITDRPSELMTLVKDAA
ncbi:glycerophosphodiester phosphodiesterase [Spartinivicinus poritis]|uniref:Glycerophosphodiester phosphodiesterase family protein n=1 Tax=Spartinivicinus poritis TaxID=2994640 RepID=A0ABT5U8A2_9GAMM|nr:glycerophosphodiester phosphodiesterase family protein [Spartinivicinus sp. A2-2]MDE1462604.1 glycerophosphodiester phosphodiesterase family protein [Spartinivicinus sp. A2-2]